METNSIEKAKPRLRYDIILISALLAVAVAFLLITLAARIDGSYVEVEQGGVAVATYRLDLDGEYPLNGGTNILVIKGGEAYLTYADCPDKTCINTGRIHYVGESIICLPNNLAITVRGSSDDGVDLVS